MRIIPQQSRIVVEPIKETGSTIIIPNSKTEDGEEMVFKRLRVIEVGTGRVLDSGVVIDIPLKVGAEVVVNGRYAHQLQPISWYGGRELYVVDYAGVLAEVVRETDEPVLTDAPRPIAVARQLVVA